MLKKLERSENAVREYLREQRHHFMLQQEEHKLKEGDIKKARERMRRLEFKKKLDIIDKEKSQERAIRIAQERDKLVLKKR